MAKTYLIDGKAMTAEEVMAIKNPSDDQKKQFIQQSNLSDEQLKLLEAIGDALVPLVVDAISNAVRPIFERLHKAETKLIEVENGGIRYQGTYQRALNYRRGDFVTHHGSMFATIRNSIPGEEPGKCDAFQLAVKRGDDAR